MYLILYITPTLRSPRSFLPLLSSLTRIFACRKGLAAVMMRAVAAAVMAVAAAAALSMVVGEGGQCHPLPPPPLPPSLPSPVLARLRPVRHPPATSPPPPS